MLLNDDQVHNAAEDEGSADEIVVKYFSNEEKRFTGIELIEVNTSDGGTKLFSKGEAIDDVPVTLDFTAGDQRLEAPLGKLVKSAIITKPIDLVPEKLLEGANIGGVIGTHKTVLVPLNVTENGVYYPSSGSVEIGGTYTFKESYTQEELQALYNKSTVIVDGATAFLISSIGTLGIMYQYGMYIPYYSTDEANHIWIPGELATQIGSTEGWHQGEDLTSMMKVGAPTFTSSENYDLYVDDITALNVLFDLSSGEESSSVYGFSSVEVNVQAKTATENITVELDFSQGDIEITPSEDILIARVDIPKPTSLIPENIKYGVDIAGISGRHRGGAIPVSISGSYQVDSSTDVNAYGVYTGPVTVYHNLGVLPDCIFISGEKYASGAILDIMSFNENIPSVRAQIGGFYIDSKKFTAYGDVSMYNRELHSSGHLSFVTPKSFTVGGTVLGHVPGASYTYTIVGGLLETDYIYIELSLDGDGNLIINGGTDAVRQYEIYVDGELVKTVDNTAENDEAMIVDISDVANEWKKYTIYVEAISDSDKMILSDEVSGNTISLTGSCGEAAIWKFNNGTLTIYGEGAIYDYTIASDNVTIDQPWFNVASEITTVNIEDGITRIGNQALRGLTNMTSISIANTVTSIGTSGLLGCKSLAEIEIPESIVSISSYAFNENTTLKTVRYTGTLSQWLDIEFSATSANPCFVGKATLYIDGELCESIIIDKDIKWAAFSGCSSVKNVEVTSSVSSIGSYAFYQCVNLEQVKIDESAPITTIAAHSFRTCQKLAYINMPTSVASIGSYAFADDSSLESIVIPSNVTLINDYAFYSCKGLVSVILSEKLTEIKQYAFANCTALASIIIPDKVHTILWRAFQGCTAIASVTIGTSVALIGDNTFYSCSKLTSAIFKDTTTWIRNSSQTSTSGTTISYSYLANASTAATYLRSTYVGYWWHKT